MSVWVMRTNSEEETIAAGEQIAARLAPPATVLLMGELGAGKTTLAKGLVKGLRAGAPDDVASPTYTLIHEYRGPVRVYHIDLYRLESPAEAVGLGLEDLLASEAVLLVEWGEKFPRLWPPDRVEVRLAAAGESAREITIGGLSAP